MPLRLLSAWRRRASAPAKTRVSAAAWREARAIFAANRRYLLLALALILVSRLAALVLPASTKWLVDDIATKGRGYLLSPLIAAIAAATLVQVGASFVLVRMSTVRAQRVITDLRRRLFAHVLHLPVATFESAQTGHLVSRIMYDPASVHNLVGMGLVHLAGGLVTAAAGTVVLVWINWWLTLVVIGVLAAFGLAMTIGLKRLRPLFGEHRAIDAAVAGRVTEALGGIRIIKSYTAEHREQRLFTKGGHDLLRSSVKQACALGANSAESMAVVGTVGIVMLGLGGHVITSGQMTTGDLVMYIFFVQLTTAPIVTVATIGTQMTEAFAGLDRIREMLSLPLEPDGRGCAPLGRVTGDVAFDDVWFEYQPGRPVLKGLSFRAPPGTTTALVGPSGAGKSTLVGLILAFAHPTRGRVLVDGRSLRDVPVAEYRRQLASVLQESFLFDGTIAENVGYARPSATRDEIVAACRVAHCEEFVRTFPDGYDTIIGERGIKLSGGQRQRVAIARAVLADPHVLILDEATSHLDGESEQLIRDSLRHLRRGRTTFVIAHRLSTIMSADQILVLDDGAIVERGRHAELLARGGRYRRLYDRQYASEIDPSADAMPAPGLAAPIAAHSA